MQETDPSAYSVILHHPGIRLSWHNATTRPKGIPLMAIRIPDYIARAAQDIQDSISMYIYDVASPRNDNDPVFLGAGTVQVEKNHSTLEPLEEKKLPRLRNKSKSQSTRLEARQL